MNVLLFFYFSTLYIVFDNIFVIAGVMLEILFFSIKG